MTRSSSLPDLTGNLLLLGKKMDAPELGFYPRSGAFVCVVKPALDDA